MNDIRVSSIKEVDLSDLKFPQVAVFSKPDDYPDKEVARVFDDGEPTNTVILSDDLEALKKDIFDNTNFLFFSRGQDDVPALIGVFL